MNKDVIGQADEATKVAINQMQHIKEVISFRTGEEKRFIEIYSRMYQQALQSRKEDEVKTEQDIEKEKQAIGMQAKAAMLRYRKAMLAQMSAEDRASALKDAKAKKEAEVDNARKAMQEKVAMATAEYTDKAEREREIAKIKRDFEKTERKAQLDISKLSDDIKQAELSVITDGFRARQQEAAQKKAIHEQDKKFLKEKLQGQGSFIEKAKATQKFLKDNPLSMKIDVEAAMKKNEEAQQAYGAVRQENIGNIEELNKTISQMESVLNDPTKSEEQKAEAEKKLAEAEAEKQRNLSEIKEAAKEANKASMEVMAGKLQEAILGAYGNATEKAETILNDYMGVIDGRMQGSDKNFKDMSDKITSKLAVSPFVQSTKVLDKLKEAAENGISYNTEQRAFLAGISDKIANTFNAFDSNLLRIIRLQQADTTATRLGMEASLTKLFNGMFQDSSYLSTVADSISAAIVDANSQLNHEASAEFEFIVQKWLGALSSLGMSENSLTQIATGLNYLATGDVTNLANNNSLQTLFAMSASNANLEYSEILLKGLDANTTNRLLESMVLYLKDIAENSDNQVVKAAYGDIFSMSLSDMRAISNLTHEEIGSLSKTTMSYDDMKTEMNNQLNQLWNRTSLSSMMTNVFDNVIYSVASDMTNNPVTFAMQKMLNFMDDTNTDINIPFINAMGFGVDLNASVKDLMQMGLGIGQAFSLTGNILSGLSSGGGLDLNSWGATETTKRGTGLNLMSTGTLGGVSGSIGTYASNTNSADIKNSTMNSATDDAEETKKVTNKNSTPTENSMDDFMKATVGGKATDFVVVYNSALNQSYSREADALRVVIGGLGFNGDALKVKDDSLIWVTDSKLSTTNSYLYTIAGYLYTLAYNNQYSLNNVDSTNLQDTNQDNQKVLTVVNSTVLDSVFDPASSSLRVSVNGLGFNGDSIKVTDSGLSNVVTSLNTLSSSLSSSVSTPTQQDTSWIGTIIGDSASSYVKTKDSGIPNVITAINSLSSSLSNSPTAPVQQDNSWISSIVGDSASSFVKTKDSGLSSVIDTSIGGIKTSVNGVVFDGGALKVNDAGVSTANGYLSTIATAVTGIANRPQTNVSVDSSDTPTSSDESVYMTMKNDVLDDVHSSNTHSLSVLINGASFDGDKLKTKDESFVTTNSHLLTISGLISTIVGRPHSTLTAEDIANATEGKESAYTVVKNTSIDESYDQNTKTLRVNVPNFNFYEGLLGVRDSAMDTVNGHLFNISSMLSTIVDRPYSTLSASDVADAMQSGEVSYTLVKNDILDSVYDGATSTLNVSVNGLNFYDGNLSIRDELLVTTNSHLSDISSMIADLVGRPQSTLTANEIADATRNYESAYTLVKNEVLDAVHNVSSNSLLVSLYGAVFSNDRLQVVDSGLDGISAHMSTINTNLQSFIDRPLTTYTIDTLISGVVGDGASDYIWTKDISANNAFDATNNSLRVTATGLTVDTDGYLKVVDDGSLASTANSLSTIRTHLTEKVVKIEFNESQAIKFDKTVQATLENAIRNAMFGSAETSDGVNLTDIVNKIADGELKVKSITDSVAVVNATGDKLQVSNLVW